MLVTSSCKMSQVLFLVDCLPETELQPVGLNYSPCRGLHSNKCQVKVGGDMVLGKAVKT